MLWKPLIVFSLDYYQSMSSLVVECTIIWFVTKEEKKKPSLNYDRMLSNLLEFFILKQLKKLL